MWHAAVRTGIGTIPGWYPSPPRLHGGESGAVQHGNYWHPGRMTRVDRAAVREERYRRRSRRLEPDLRLARTGSRDLRRAQSVGPPSAGVLVSQRTQAVVATEYAIATARRPALGRKCTRRSVRRRAAMPRGCGSGGYISPIERFSSITCSAAARPATMNVSSRTPHRRSPSVRC